MREVCVTPVALPSAGAYSGPAAARRPRDGGLVPADRGRVWCRRGAGATRRLVAACHDGRPSGLSLGLCIAGVLHAARRLVVAAWVPVRSWCCWLRGLGPAAAGHAVAVQPRRLRVRRPGPPGGRRHRPLHTRPGRRSGPAVRRGRRRLGTRAVAVRPGVPAARKPARARRAARPSPPYSAAGARRRSCSSRGECTGCPIRRAPCGSRSRTRSSCCTASAARTTTC